MQTASIIVIPSIWQEPYGLVVSEAMSNGIAIITSDVGGIPEVLNNNGVLIENITEEKISEELYKMINSTETLKYDLSFWQKQEVLFLEMMSQFQSFAEKNNFTVISTFKFSYFFFINRIV